MNKPSKPPTVEDALDELDALNHANLNAALIAAQAELPAPRKDREVEVFSRRTNSKYKFKYATMAGMMETDKPVLARHGLGFVQFVSDGAMVTRILHKSGEALDCPLPMPSLPDAPQEAGSLITYFKRYSYSAAFGRVADEEDDANIAEGNSYTPKASAARPSEGVSRPANGDAPFPLGPAKNKTELKAMGRDFWREVESSADPDEFECLLADKTNRLLVKQMIEALPSWWEGGDRNGEPFEGLEAVIARRRKEFEQENA